MDAYLGLYARHSDSQGFQRFQRFRQIYHFATQRASETNPKKKSALGRLSQTFSGFKDAVLGSQSASVSSWERWCGKQLDGVTGLMLKGVRIISREKDGSFVTDNGYKKDYAVFTKALNDKTKLLDIYGNPFDADVPQTILADFLNDTETQTHFAIEFTDEQGGRMNASKNQDLENHDCHFKIENIAIASVKVNSEGKMSVVFNYEGKDEVYGFVTLTNAQKQVVVRKIRMLLEKQLQLVV